jgi:hypothetical protein
MDLSMKIDIHGAVFSHACQTSPHDGRALRKGNSTHLQQTGLQIGVARAHVVCRLCTATAELRTRRSSLLPLLLSLVIVM